jgi:hypothetical protein
MWQHTYISPVASQTSRLRRDDPVPHRRVHRLPC